jgi:hypothetical protein
MSWKILKRSSYIWPVAHVISIRGGRSEVIEFDCEFKALPQTRVRALMERAAAGEMTDPKLLDEVLLGWEGLTDDHDKNFEFGSENLAALLDLYPGLNGAIVRAFVDSVSGGAVLRKN